MDFTNKVAIVTGAASGLGRSHALALAERGCKVVINDVGGARDGRGASMDAASLVVNEITQKGGEAMADYADITDPKQVETLVTATLSRWGRIDILINNAGILRDKTFAKGSLEDFQKVVDVHLMGTVNCTKAVWDIMRDQGYGRIVVTTSSSGLYGNFGQANYSAAKMGVVGLMNTLKLEGAKYNVKINALAPIAATRMTEDLIPHEVQKSLTPESVTPGVLFLASHDAPTGEILCAGAGCFAVARIVETQGAFVGRTPSPDDIQNHWEQISAPAQQAEMNQGSDQTSKFLAMSAP